MSKELDFHRKLLQEHLNELDKYEIRHYLNEVNGDIDGENAEKDGISYENAYHLSVASTLINVVDNLKRIDRGEELVIEEEKEAPGLKDLMSKLEGTGKVKVIKTKEDLLEALKEITEFLGGDK